MAKQDLGKIVPTFNGIYNANIVYEKLCIVNYKGSVYVSKKDIPKGTDISNEEYWYLLIEKLKKGVDYFTEEDRKAIIDEVTKLAESDFNKYYDEKKKALDKVASDNTAAFLKVVKDNTTDFNSNVDTQTKAFDTHYDEKVKSFDENSDKQTKAYDTNANKKLNDYNENHKTKMQELDDEATVKIAEYDKHTEELRNMAVSTDNELERVKSDILDTGSASDTFIHVEDSCMAKLKELEIEGVVNQKTTTGKNLFDENNLTRNLVLENGDITTNASWNMSNYIEVSGNTNYVVKRNDTARTSQSFILIEFDVDKKIIKRNVQGVRNTNIPYTITTTDTTRYLIFNYNNTYNNTMLQLEKGDTSTDYEPYTGGQPSPSPEFPQEIKTITDSLKVTSCGKNLVERMVLGELNTKTGIFERSSTIICNEHYIPYDSIKQYYIKVDNAPATANIRWYNQKFEYIGYGTTQSSGLINKYVYTDLTSYIPSDTTPKYFKIRRADVALLNSTWCVSIDPNYFGEYVVSLITANLPEGEFIGKLDDTYKDVLRTEYDQEDSKYHLKLDKMVGMGDTSKYFGKVKRITTKQNNYRFTFDINIDKIPKSDTEPGVTYPLYCDKFIKGSRATSYSEINSISYGTGVDIYAQFVLYYSEISGFTQNQFSDWLTNNPLIIYYILQTPYTLDLGPIDIPLSYKEITNIFTDSDLLPKINAEYYRTFQTTIQNLQINEKSLKQEITDLNNSISDITKRLDTLESSNATTAEESEVSNDLQN